MALSLLMDGAMPRQGARFTALRKLPALTRNGIKHMRSTILNQIQAMETIGGGTFARELIGLFLAECDARFARIDAALCAGNLGEVGRLLHQVQGSAASTGATRLRLICALGEEACRQANLTQVARACRLGSKEFGALRPVLEAWKNQ